MDNFYNNHFRGYWSPPVGTYSNSLMGMLGVIGLSLSMDKATYKVGESPIYRITGAIPGATIAWSSTKNGQQTGEYQASYGAKVDANGTAEVTGGAWTDADKGQWTKTAMILKPDGTYDLSNVASFSVIAAQAAQPSPTQSPSAGSFLDGNVTLPVIGSVPKVGALIGAGVLAYFLTKRGR